jgi:hypothetical protein
MKVLGYDLMETFLLNRNRMKLKMESQAIMRLPSSFCVDSFSFFAFIPQPRKKPLPGRVLRDILSKLISQREMGTNL